MKRITMSEFEERIRRYSFVPVTCLALQCFDNYSFSGDLPERETPMFNVKLETRPYLGPIISFSSADSDESTRLFLNEFDFFVR